MRNLILSCLAIITWGLTSTKAFAFDIAVENEDGVTIYYNYINDGTELEVTRKATNFHYVGETIKIPESVTYMNRTRKVTSIGSCAFYECRDDVKSVIMPSCIANIGPYAFYRCWSIKSLTIPASLKHIGVKAFYECWGLSKVIIQDIAAWCGIIFEGDTSSSDSFACRSNPLYACHLYKDENTEISNLVIPSSVTSISNFAFMGCSSLTSVTLPSSVTNIGTHAFYECSGLTSVIIPSNVKNICFCTFYHCTGLTSVTIPSSVTSICESAFCGCSGLTNVTIPESVTTIGDGAFCGSGLTSVIIPESVTSIGYSAFSGCSGLTSVTIPSSMTEIGKYAFKCKSLSTVVSKQVNPFAITNDVFTQDTYMNADLFVPIGSKEKYETTQGWKNFKFIQEGVPSSVKSVTQPEPGSHEYYTIDGKPLSAPIKGLNIVKESDGTTKKIYTK